MLHFLIKLPSNILFTRQSQQFALGECLISALRLHLQRFLLSDPNVVLAKVELHSQWRGNSMIQSSTHFTQDTLSNFLVSRQLLGLIAP